MLPPALWGLHRIVVVSNHVWIDDRRGGKKNHGRGQNAEPDELS